MHRLRELRKRAGLSLDEAARKLDKSRSALNRIETGQGAADFHLVRSMMDLYHQYDEGLITLAREAAKQVGNASTASRISATPPWRRRPTTFWN